MLKNPFIDVSDIYISYYKGYTAHLDSFINIGTKKKCLENIIRKQHATRKKYLTLI